MLLALPAPSALDPLTIRAVRPDPGDAAEVSAVAERVDAQRRLLLSVSGPGAPAMRIDAEEQIRRNDLGYGELPASRGLQQAALKRLRDDAAEQVRPDGTGHGQGHTRKRRDRRADRRSASSVRGGDHTLSKAQRALRAAFYLWLGAANLVRPSTLEPWLQCCCSLSAGCERACRLLWL